MTVTHPSASAQSAACWTSTSTKLGADFFKDVEPLTAWQLYDELLAIVGKMYAYLNSVEMEAEIGAVERRKHKLGTRARRMRDELLPMLSAWRDSLIALRSTLWFQFGGRGIRLMKEAITAELAHGRVRVHVAWLSP